MKVHRFIAFLIGAVFHETGTLSFDLDAASSLLLYMLYVGTTSANDLRA